MSLTGLFKNSMKSTETKEEKNAAKAIEISEDELDAVAGGQMAASLYAYAHQAIESSGIAQVLKQKAFEELNRMRTSGTAYSPTDVEAMLKKRGVK